MDGTNGGKNSLGFSGSGNSLEFGGGNSEEKSSFEGNSFKGGEKNAANDKSSFEGGENSAEKSSGNSDNSKSFETENSGMGVPPLVAEPFMRIYNPPLNIKTHVAPTEGDNFLSKKQAH